MSHKTSAIVITCIDFRFQEYIDKWLDERFKSPKQFDRVALAGAIFDLYTILKQVEISNRLHEIKTVILMNHEDCGAYGQAGTYAKHTDDLLNAKSVIDKLYPHLNVEPVYMHMDGTVEKISAQADNNTPAAI